MNASSHILVVLHKLFQVNVLRMSPLGFDNRDRGLKHVKEDGLVWNRDAIKKLYHSTLTY